jgi:hypothetical protein
MSNLARFVVTFAICAASISCDSNRDLGPYATVPAPTIRGTLYVTRTTSKDQLYPNVDVYRDGKQVGSFPWIELAGPPGHRIMHSRRVLLARNDPSISIRDFSIPEFSLDRSWRDPECTNVAISPKGVLGACVIKGAKFTLAIFRVGQAAARRDTHIVVDDVGRPLEGFLDDSRIAVIANDESCPFFRRADRHFSDEPQARLMVVDQTGKVLSRGACAHGVITGDGVFALIGHDSQERSQYSLDDGKTWLTGEAVAFDGGNHVLLVNMHRQLVDSMGRLVADEAAGATWTK